MIPRHEHEKEIIALANSMDHRNSLTNEYRIFTEYVPEDYAQQRAELERSIPNLYFSADCYFLSVLVADAVAESFDTLP